MPNIEVSVLDTDALDKPSKNETQTLTVSNASSSLNASFSANSLTAGDTTSTFWVNNDSLTNTGITTTIGTPNNFATNSLIYTPPSNYWNHYSYQPYYWYYIYNSRVAYDKKTLEVKVMIPDFKKEEVSVTLHNDAVKVVCKRKTKVKKTWDYQNGWDENEYEQTVALPVRVVKKGIRAKILNGILTLTFKREDPEIKIL